MDSTLLAVSYFRSTKRIEMYDDLYEYFILHKQLSLPGIGLFSLVKKPSEADFANRVVHPPTYDVNFVEAQSTPNKGFFIWLAMKMNISYSEAIVNFNAFAFDLKNEILSGAKVVWPRMGVFIKGYDGTIKVEPIIENSSDELAAPALKVLRDKAEHTIRVGEEERTSTEMEALLHSTDRRKWNWKWAAIAIASICLIAMVIHFAINGINTSNSRNLTPAKTTSLHRVIQ